MKIEVEMLKKNGGFWDEHGEFEKGLKEQDNEQLKVFEGKLKKFKKTDQETQNTRFSQLS